MSFLKLSKKRLALLFLAVILLIALILFLANPKAADALFCRSEETPLALSWGSGTEFRDIPYASNSGSQQLDLYLPADGKQLPLLVIVPGDENMNCSRFSDAAQRMTGFFRDHGFACAVVGYRPAQEAACPGAIEDIKAAIRFLRANADEYGIDGSRIALFGESSGGYLAAMAAVTPEDRFSGVKFAGQDDSKVSAEVPVLIDFCGISEPGAIASDFREEHMPAVFCKAASFSHAVPKVYAAGYHTGMDYFLRTKTADVPNTDLTEYSPMSYVSALAPDRLRCILVHGELDLIAPAGQTKRFEAALSARLGSDSVFTSYPYACRHADPCLYTEEILTSVLEQTQKFLNK